MNDTDICIKLEDDFIKILLEEMIITLLCGNENVVKGNYYLTEGMTTILVRKYSEISFDVIDKVIDGVVNFKSSTALLSSIFTDTKFLQIVYTYLNNANCDFSVINDLITKLNLLTDDEYAEIFREYVEKFENWREILDNIITLKDVIVNLLDYLVELLNKEKLAKETIKKSLCN